MRYKLVLFDFDGTLADSFPWFLKTVNAVADKYRFKRIETHEVDRLRGLSGSEMMAHLELPMWKLPMVAAEMRSRMKACAADIRLFDGVDHMLQRLVDCGVHAAVVTSNSYDNVHTILGSRNAAHIRHFECGASIFGKKAKFRKVLGLAGVAPHEVLCVGDEIRDAQAARAAGLDFVGVSWGYTRPDALAPWSGNKLFRSVDEIAEMLCHAPSALARNPL